MSVISVFRRMAHLGLMSWTATPNKPDYIIKGGGQLQDSLTRVRRFSELAVATVSGRHNRFPLQRRWEARSSRPFIDQQADAFIRVLLGLFSYAGFR
jgi:hypothetical protein